MGQKVHPVGIRLGIVRNWLSRWYADSRTYANTLHEDILVREMLMKKLSHASVSHIDIERPARNARIIIHTARPGIIIGKGGKEIEELRTKIGKMIGVPVHIDISEIRKPDINAQLVADSISQQLVRRIAFRRAMKRAVTNTMRAGASGIKICVSGRLGGAEIARSEWYREGSVPLHTFRSDIDYGFSEALTTYGIIGIKVWICRGEVLAKKDVEQARRRPNKEKAKKGKEEA